MNKLSVTDIISKVQNTVGNGFDFQYSSHTSDRYFAVATYRYSITFNIFKTYKYKTNEETGESEDVSTYSVVAIGLNNYNPLNFLFHIHNPQEIIDLIVGVIISKG